MSTRLFDRQHAVIGVIHLLPLPGSANWQGDWAGVVAQAKSDAAALALGGVDAIIIENYGDSPFAKGRVDAATVSAMTAVISQVPTFRQIPFGVNVLRNDGESAVAIAAVTGASFVRINVLVGAMITDQGIIEGCARDVALLKRQLSAKVDIWADILVKHAAPLGATDPVQIARDTLFRAGASAIIVSGSGTGQTVDRGRLETLANANLDAPILIGSGAAEADLPWLKPLCQGFIVATSLKDPVTGRPDPQRVQGFVSACRS
ncbi:MAG: BtpA/SgcQ family protein [Candidatus Sericytochromatia bacterium]|nr:BtpA/SgcQ family protein [Candidatus Sericytochromatia bacterium]